MFLPKGIFRQGRRETGQPGSTDDHMDPKPVSAVPPTGTKHLLKLLVHVPRKTALPPSCHAGACSFGAVLSVRP